MKQLELKHIAAYLPYGLKFISGRGKAAYMTIDWCYMEARSPHGSCIGENISSKSLMRNFKPILHPLSDLTKPIEYNGERFVPSLVIVEEFDIDLDENMEFMTQGSGEGGYLLNSLTNYYLIIQKLLEWHFDVHGLIDAGLAIDINTLNEAKSK